MKKALQYAEILDCKTVHVMSGNIVPLMLHERQRALFKYNLAKAADMALDKGVKLVIEPINHRNMPQYFLEKQDEGQTIVAELNKPNLAVQFDIYHCQITDGDVATRLKRDMPTIGHIQIAGVPDRHEPDQGKSITNGFSATWTHSAIPAGQAANTSPRETPAPGSAGSRHGKTNKRFLKAKLVRPGSIAAEKYYGRISDCPFVKKCYTQMAAGST